MNDQADKWQITITSKVDESGKAYTKISVQYEGRWYHRSVTSKVSHHQVIEEINGWVQALRRQAVLPI